jgi:hypothetical protein
VTVPVVYLYALVDGESSGPLGEGLAGEPLRLLHCGAFSAVVGEPGGPPHPDRDSLQAQDAVVRRLAERFGALLPARFGEAFADDAALIDRIAGRTSGIADALALVHGCVQMTLRVFGDPGPPEERADPTGGPGTRYLEARRREQERSRSLPEIDPLRETLRPLLRAERIERQEAGRLLGTAYHLVPRERTGAYLAVLEKAGGEIGGRKISASGPWPPYAFGPDAQESSS